MLFILPVATLLHVHPGTPLVMKAFVDKGTYAFLTNNSYSQWLQAMKRYSDQNTVLLEDIGLMPFHGSFSQLITAINFRVNNIDYMHDDENYGPMEYFATPREMLDRGAGDCEDYAILKMHLLVAAGFPPEDLFLTVGLYTYPDGDVGGHAVLFLRDGNGTLWVLDNMRNSIIPAHQYKQFEPMAAINWSGFYLLGALAH